MGCNRGATFASRGDSEPEYNWNVEVPADGLDVTVIYGYVAMHEKNPHGQLVF